jgi:hypothetical protein
MKEPSVWQSTILYEDRPKTAVAFIHNHVFYTDALFIRIENVVGARSALASLCL